MQKTILLTGATGTCGSYLAQRLLQTTRGNLILWVRQAERLAPSLRNHRRVQVWEGGLQALPLYLEPLQQVQILVHPVTAWGGEDCFKVNNHLTKALFKALDPDFCEHIHYFSTASLLDSQHQFRRQTLQRGTDYIRSKAVMHQCLKRGLLAIPTSIYYPTLILGGEVSEAGYPLTPLTASLFQWPLYLRLLRLIKAQAYLHFIHAEDIAKIIAERIVRRSVAQDLVLGNPAQSVAELMHMLLTFWQIAPAPVQVRLESLLPVLLPLLSPWMNPWDRYSLTTLETRYDACSASDLGLESRFQDWQSVCQQLGIKPS